MSLSELSRRQFMLLALQLLVASQLPACRSRYPVLGRDPVPACPVEDHHQALARWAESGVRDAVLVNIDTHDDMRWIPEGKIESLQRIYRNREWQTFGQSGSLHDDRLYHVGNWIYAGGRLGIFREVYWVIPFNVLSMNDTDRQMRRFLKEYEFNDEEIATFVLKGRRFHGSFHGIPLTVCDLRSLPDTGSPLLLSIDTDFFPPCSASREESYLTVLHGMFQELHRKQYAIRDAVVSCSINGDFLPPYLRWVGDTVTALLEKPDLLREAPSEPLLLLQELENAYREADAGAMGQLLQRWQGKHHKPSVGAYEALCHLLREDPESAFRAVSEACGADRRYCTLFPYLGTYYYTGGQYVTAERFFLAGFAAVPDMANGLFYYAHCLRKMGRLREALAWYEKDEVANGVFPSRFLIAEIQLILNDSKAATASIARAVEHLTANRYASVVNRETARAIYAALDFCKRGEGQALYRTLSTNPAVLRMFTAYPRQAAR